MTTDDGQLKVRKTTAGVAIIRADDHCTITNTVATDIIGLWPNHQGFTIRGIGRTVAYRFGPPNELELTVTATKVYDDAHDTPTTPTCQPKKTMPSLPHPAAP